MRRDIDSHGNKTISKLVATEGMTRTYELSDQTYEERVGGSASWRHNNPGNLKMEYALSADPTVRTHRSKEEALAIAISIYEGTIDLDQRGNIIFDTYDHGRAAQENFISNARNMNKNVAELLGNYSRPDYSGPTHYDAQEAMIYDKGDKEGFDLRTKKIKDMSPQELGALADGISTFEGYSRGQTNPLTAEQAAERQVRAHQNIRDASVRSDASVGLRAPTHHPAFLKQGDRGAGVGTLQHHLRALGYTDSRGNPIHVDENFGPATEAAVKAFQASHGLASDGKVGVDTTHALNEHIQNRKDSSFQLPETALLCKTGSPYIDRLMASVDDPLAFKQAMTDLSNSPTGQAFYAEGRAQYAEMQNQMLQTQLSQQHALQQAQPLPARVGPVMTR